MNATDILSKAAQHMEDRAATYDKPEGERSMAQTVAIFNLHHSTELTEAQGWHLLQILKDVRLFTRPGYHADSAEDGVAYAALKAEALAAADIDRGYAELLDKSSAVQQALKGVAESFLAEQAGDVRPKIDSGPMWVEWRGESEVPPVAEDVMVEVRSRDGEAEIGLAGYFEWMHGVLSYDHDIVAWREPWPDDERIDAIGQNGATDEHY